MQTIMKKSDKNTTELAPITGALVADVMPELDDITNMPKFTEQLPIEMKVNLIEGMASHFMTPDEICSTVRMTRGEFEGNLEFQAAYQRGYDMGKGSLRRMQFVKAKKDTIMQIWMGKQYLDQHDKLETKKGEDREDAYKGFLNKLQIELNVSTTGKPAVKVVGEGTGDRDVHLGVVGPEQSARTDERGVVGEASDPRADQELVRRSDERGAHV